MKKVLTAVFLAFLATPSHAQLQNYLQALSPDSGVVLYGSPTGSTPFWTIFTNLATSTDSIMSSLQKYGQSIDNYSSVANAKAAAKAKSGLLIVPRKSRLYQDSTITIAAGDSIVVFDFRDGELTIDGQTNIIASVSLTDTGTFNITYDSNDNGTGNFLILEGSDTAFVIKNLSETVFNESSNDLDFRVETDTNRYMIHIDSNGERIAFAGDGTPSVDYEFNDPTASGNGTTVSFQSTSSTTRNQIQFYRNDASPAADDILLREIIYGEDGAGNLTEFSRRDIILDTPTSGSENSRIKYEMQLAGSLVEYLTIDGSDSAIVFNDDSKDFNFRIESDGNTAGFFLDGGSGRIGVNTATPDGAFHIINSGSNEPNFTLENTNANTSSAIVILEKNSSSPADNDYAGQIRFVAWDSLQSTAANMLLIEVFQEDMTTGSMSGSINFDVFMDQTARSLLFLDGYNGTQDEGQIIFNDDSQDINYFFESDNETNALTIEGSTGNIGMGTSTPSEDLHLLETINGFGPEVEIENISLLSGNPVLRLLHTNSGSGIANASLLGEIEFIGEDGSGTETEYGYLRFVVDDTSRSSEDSDMNLAGIIAGAAMSLIHYDGATTSLILNDDSKDIDTIIESDNDANAVVVQGSSGNVGFGTNDPDDPLTVILSAPIFTMTDSDLNINTTSAAEQKDTTAIVFDASSATPSIKIIDNTGVTVFNTLVAESHATMGFADSSHAIAATQNNTFLVSNAAGDLFADGISRNITITGDSIQVQETGDYEIHWDLSYSGANTDVYHITVHINAAEQSGKGEAHRGMTGTDIGVSAGHTMLSLSANDWITLRIKNTANSNDPTMIAGNITVKGL